MAWFKRLWKYLLCLSIYIPVIAEESNEIVINSVSFEYYFSRHHQNYECPFSLKISNESFSKEASEPVQGVDQEQLEVLTYIETTKGNLTITAKHHEFKSLRFFKSLKAITYGYLVITNTSLVTLDLINLKEIGYGVVIEHNEHLCVNESREFWQSMIQLERGVIRVSNNKPQVECTTVCDKVCDENLGCWGPGPGQCRSCKHVLDFDRETCISGCDNDSQYEEDSDIGPICKNCDDECKGCYGPEPEDCKSCKRLRRDDECVSDCHLREYKRKDVCMECHETCPLGCSGPNDYEGLGGCDPCEKAVFIVSRQIQYYEDLGFLNNIYKCLGLNESCPDGFYQDRVPPDAVEGYGKLKGKLICVSCHPHCLKCTRYGLNRDDCQECEPRYKNCLCSSGEYFRHGPRQLIGACFPCLTGCKECKEDASCVGCHDGYFRAYRGLVASEDGSYNCTKTCPKDQPYPLFNDRFQNYCSLLNYTLIEDYKAVNTFNYMKLSLPAVLCLAFLVAYIYLWNQANSYKSRIVVEKFLELNDDLPNTTDIEDGGTKLIIVSESNLKTIESVHVSTFNTVCRGVLVLKTKTRVRVPVAMKIYKQDSSYVPYTNELLKEAMLLGRLSHPHLLRLLAISLTSELTMITMFMPLGDLLHYLRQHGTEIKPRTLIAWSKQIAEGMEYLENQGLVHRKLAAKKVLIQSPNRIKVTYHGDEKHLNAENSFFAYHVKTSFQWLALETLKQRLFTNKSDVWSFGVVLWEMFTYGEEPYLGISLPELLRSLEVGQRLTQPELCSSDMYSVLVRCWVEDPSARPSFQELVETFSEMSRDSTRFIFPTREEDNTTAPEVPARLYYGMDDVEQSEVTARTHHYVNTDVQNPDILYENHQTTS